MQNVPNLGRRGGGGRGRGRENRAGELCDNVYIVSIISTVSILNTRGIGSREISLTEETRYHHFAMEAELDIRMQQPAIFDDGDHNTRKRLLFKVHTYT